MTFIIKDQGSRGSKPYWLGTTDGAIHYDDSTGEFSNIIAGGLLGTILKSPTRMIHLYKDTVFVAGKEGLVWHDKAKGQWNLEFITEIVYDIEESQDGRWYASDAGLFEYDKSSRDLERIQKGEYYALLLEGDTIWAGSSEGLMQYSLSNQSFRKVLENMSVIGIVRGGDDLFLNTGEGVLRYNPSSGETDEITGYSGEEVKVILPYNSLLFIGTDSGLNVLDMNHDLWMLAPVGAPAGALLEVDGTLWTGVKDYINIFTLKTSTTSILYPEDGDGFEHGMDIAFAASITNGQYPFEHHWVSDLDQEFGGSPFFSYSGLSPGSHEITLISRDRFGMTSSDTVNLDIALSSKISTTYLIYLLDIWDPLDPKSTQDLLDALSKWDPLL